MTYEAEAARLRRQIAAAEAQIAQLRRPRTSDEMNQISDAFARADAVDGQFGERALDALPGESTLAYRKRLAQNFKRYSAKFRDADLSFMDSATLRPVEEQIYNDAVAAANDPASYPPGTLKAIQFRDESGRTCTKYVGDCGAWLQAFTTPGAVGRFRDPRHEK